MQKKSISQLFDLSSKTAIVTGGAMGIGLSIAYRLGEAGANILIVDIDEKTGSESLSELINLGFNASFLKADVSLENDMKNIVDFCLSKYGGIDILVNNAGIYPVSKLSNLTNEFYEKVMSINLKSAIFLTKLVSEVMKKQGGGGKIINITSIDALHPSGTGLSIYDASKHAMWGFTKNIALELSEYNILVNSIAPGSINTPGTGYGKNTTPELEKIKNKFIERIPMKRSGDPDEIGKVALFLASDLSSYMTGSQLIVDGGVLLS